MKLVRYNDTRLGLLTDAGGIVDLTDRLDLTSADPLLEYVRSDQDASEYTDADPDHQRGDVSLEAPIGRPPKLVAIPGNYASHIGELPDEYVDPDRRETQAKKGVFLKATSSIVGPGGTIQIPFADRRVDHELELGFVISDTARKVSLDEAPEYIFGYTMGLDISIRGKEDRSMRKSLDSFSPLGPSVVTADEFGVRPSLDMHLTVDGETRHDANTGQMITTPPEIIWYVSQVMTLEPGDVVITGTPSGVGPLEDGDDVHAEIERIGGMDLSVSGEDREFADIFEDG